MLKVFVIALGLVATILLAGALYLYWQYKSIIKYNDMLGSTVTTLHRLAREGELESLEIYLNGNEFNQNQIDDLDIKGATPMAYAIGREHNSLEVVKLLANAGADLRLEPVEGVFGEFSGAPMSLAIKNLNLPVIQFLVEQGVDLHRVEKTDYNAFLILAYASYDNAIDKILPLIDYFIEHNVDINQKSKYNESVINTFYRFNRFDVLAHLRNKNINLSELNLSELMQAILFADVKTLEMHLKDYQRNGSLDTELSHRAHLLHTPLMLAILHGNVEKTGLLHDYGADLNVQGRFGETLPFYAINSNNPQMLAWLLDQHDFDLNVKTEHKTGLLDESVFKNKIEATKTLLKNGLSVNQENENGFTILYDANSAKMAELLLSYGANPKDLTHETKRLLLGMLADPTDEYTLLDKESYLAGRYVEYGKKNPTRITDKFKLTMIKSGASPWEVTKLFDPDRDIYEGKPIWNVQRYGQSFTRLSDGRVIEIGGEHEDYYDPDFQIYNDVIVHNDEGNIELYTYPKNIFPPTDFHSATLVGEKIYIIGSLGYDAKPGNTPVYTLDINDYRIEKVKTSGSMPGKIYKHRAVLTDDTKITITDGKIYQAENQDGIDNEDVYLLDVNTHRWTKIDK